MPLAPERGPPPNAVEATGVELRGDGARLVAGPRRDLVRANRKLHQVHRIAQVQNPNGDVVREIHANERKRMAGFGEIEALQRLPPEALDLRRDRVLGILGQIEDGSRREVEAAASLASRNESRGERRTVLRA